MPSSCQEGLDDSSADVVDSLSESGQERLVTILDQYLIDVEEGRQVDVAELLRDNADIAGPLRHYLDGLQLVRELAQESNPDLLHSVPLSRDPLSPCKLGPRDQGTREGFSRRGGMLGRAMPRRGSHLGPYELREIIGRGAMGVVYRAFDARHQRQVAVKVLAFGSMVDRSRIDRFRREAKTAAALEHPHVVPVYAVGCEAGINYYAMQLIEGASLDRRLLAANQLADNQLADNHELQQSEIQQSEPQQSEIQQSEPQEVRGENIEGLAGPLMGPDRFRRIAQLGVAAARALDAAHRAGVIHRDVKPSNLLLGNDGQLWVTDFGLARVQAENGLTRTGELIGTVRYMSPEQASGHGDMIDARTDVYGLGATLYELVTGVPPFPGDDMLELLKRIQTSEPPSPQQHDPLIPRNLETIIRRAMRPRPADRYQTAEAMAEDLRRFASGRPILAHAVTLAERCIGWTLNHRRLAMGLLALWTSVLTFSLIAVALLMRGQASTNRALQQSEEHYRQARSIVDSLGSSVAQRLATIPEAESVRQQILSETIKYYEQFIADSNHDPRLSHDVLQTRLEIARLSALSGSYAQAESAYCGVLLPYGLEQQEKGKGASSFSGSAAERLLCVQALNEWGLLASEHGDQVVAQQRLETAQHILASQPSRARQQNTLIDQPLVLAEQRKATLAQALTYNNLAVVKLRQSQPRDSARALQRAITILRLIPADELRGEGLGGDVADAFSNLSVLLGDAQQYVAATRAAEQSLAVRRHWQPAQAPEYQERTAITYNNLAAYHWKEGRNSQAIDAYQQAAEMLEQAIREAPSRMMTRQRLAVTLNNLGMALVTQSESENKHAASTVTQEAEQVFQRAAALAEQAVAADPTDAEAVRQLAGIQSNHAVYLRQHSRLDEAAERQQHAEKLLQSISTKSD